VTASASEVLPRGNLVAGQWIGDPDREWIADRSPADTEDVVTMVATMDAAEVGAAYTAARSAAPIWSAESRVARGRVMFRVAAILRERADAIARVISSEMGKTLAEATGEVQRSADFFEYYAGFGRAPRGIVLPDGRPGVTAWTNEEPLGVVLLITPWNDPLLTPCRKLAPALVSGNAVVLKPASDAPASSLALAAACHDAGLPAGVLNTVTGPSSAIEAALLDNGEIDAVSFTGSTAVGLGLQRRLAGRNVRLETEMGGKNATVVMADADLDLAVATIMGAGFGQAGQRCTATSRVIAAGGVYDELVGRLQAALTAVRVGPPLDPQTTMGPVASQRQLTVVEEAVSQAAAQGATTLSGGKRLHGAPFDRGWFVEPTLIGDVSSDMSIWTNEVFGPVVAMSRVADLDEAVTAANDSEYGLAASIFTTDLSAAHTFAARVNAGQVGINLPTSGWDVHQPFGGFGLSGSAFKEQGIEGLRFFTRLKSVALRA
jgi:acyl-CoA reductase-like NAD-dependent aldehyde dehydrogenase